MDIVDGWAIFQSIDFTHCPDVGFVIEDWIEIVLEHA